MVSEVDVEAAVEPFGGAVFDGVRPHIVNDTSGSEWISTRASDSSMFQWRPPRSSSTLCSRSAAYLARTVPGDGGEDDIGHGSG